MVACCGWSDQGLQPVDPRCLPNDPGRERISVRGIGKDNDGSSASGITDAQCFENPVVAAAVLEQRARGRLLEFPTQSPRNVAPAHVELGG